MVHSVSHDLHRDVQVLHKVPVSFRAGSPWAALYCYHTSSPFGEQCSCFDTNSTLSIRESAKVETISMFS
jgi:hypothetical protein